VFPNTKILPIFQVAILITITMFHLIYMLLVKPFEERDLNILEICNNLFLYGLSVMMLMKTNSPEEPNTSGLYLDSQ